jgi:type II secretory pathway pseudopilin PulG
MKHNPMKAETGFSLVDLSITLLVGSLLMSGFVSMFSSRVHVEREADSQQAVREARQALISYAIANGRLPCPANPAIPAGQENAGLAGSVLDDQCSHGYYGVLPWATLGLKELDAWGHRLSYRVARELVQVPASCEGEEPRQTCLAPPTRAYASAATQDALGVRELIWTNGKIERTEPIANGLAAVVLSAGPNGALAFSSTGVRRRSITTIAMEYELLNATPGSVTFYSSPTDGRGPECRIAASGTPCAFDDIVGWISRGDILMAIAKAGFKL